MVNKACNIKGNWLYCRAFSSCNRKNDSVFPSQLLTAIKQITFPYLLIRLLMQLSTESQILTNWHRKFYQNPMEKQLVSAWENQEIVGFPIVEIEEGNW